MVGLLCRGAEDREDGVAGKLHRRAAFIGDRWKGGGEVSVQERDHLGRRPVLGVGGVAAEVGEHDGHLRDLAAQLQPAGIRARHPHELGRQVSVDHRPHRCQHPLLAAGEDADEQVPDEGHAGQVQDEEEVDQRLWRRLAPVGAGTTTLTTISAA